MSSEFLRGAPSTSYFLDVKPDFRPLKKQTTPYIISDTRWVKGFCLVSFFLVRITYVGFITLFISPIMVFVYAKVYRFFPLNVTYYFNAGWNTLMKFCVLLVFQAIY